MPRVSASKYVVHMGWADSPHLDPEAQERLLASTQPYLRRARKYGEPALGAGAIYPIPLEDILVDPFKIPDHWPRAYALDVGWVRTAVLWGAINQDTSTVYFYTEHYRGEAEPSVHAAAIRARGDWIPGVIDPAARGRAQRDGQILMQNYIDLGLNLQPAENAVSAGIDECWEMLSQGRIKVMRTCQHFQAEYRVYRRDEKGKIVKKNDHLMDDMRMFVLSGMGAAIVQPRIGPRQVGTGPADRRAGY